MYDPGLGRFLQTDPIGYQDDKNLYAYVRNDPLNLSDPTGKCAVVCTGGLGFAGGVLIDIGVQTMIEGKSLRDIDVGRALTSGVKGALIASGGFTFGEAAVLAGGARFGGSTVGAALGGAMGSIGAGESPRESVIATTTAVLGAKGGELVEGAAGRFQQELSKAAAEKLITKAEASAASVGTAVTARVFSEVVSSLPDVAAQQARQGQAGTACTAGSSQEPVSCSGR